LSPDQVNFTGEVESVIYHNDDNGFTVFTVSFKEGCGRAKQLATLNGSDAGSITCTSFLPSIGEGELLSVEGALINNPRYGQQVSATRIEKKMPESLDGIEKYLGSGLLKGVGIRTARRIVENFGKKTFDIIEEEPEKLTIIKGINLEKALRISETFHSQAALRGAVLFLQDFGITPVYAMKIYKRYQAATVDVVRANPYKLADDIDGIGFKIADSIASRIGVASDSDERISAGVRFILWEAAGGGHTFLNEIELLEQTRALLGVDRSIVSRQLAMMQLDGLIYRDKSGGVYLSVFYNAEQYVARKLAELGASGRRGFVREGEAADSLRAIEGDSGLELSFGQREAVISAYESGVAIITGGPGTGKTTAINAIIKLYEARGMSTLLAAPTGRAAKRMAEATGLESKTIHRLLESSFAAEDSRRQSFGRDENNPIEADAIIVDEMSMVDILLMQSLLKAVAAGTRLVLVGDVDQLPSVGPGNVLRDMIESDCFKVSRLTEIFRQARESAIVLNAHKINSGEYPDCESKSDFFLMRRTNPEDVAETVVELVTRRLPKYLNGEASIQVLTPMRKSALGSVSLNQLLQRRMNPPSPAKREREFRSLVFREGDKVMQIKNNYAASWKSYDERGVRDDEGEGVFNGDCGLIKKIDEENELMTVLFDDNRRVEYDFTQLDELELAYAVTIHKSQGSEYKAVVVPLLGGPPLLFNRNLLYTSVTRAKELVVIVGTRETLAAMVDNNREVNRNTSLAMRIKRLMDVD